MLFLESEWVMKNIELKKSRESFGISQIKIAKEVGISEVCYQRYESGERIPRVDVAIKIAEALHSTVEHLFKKT